MISLTKEEINNTTCISLIHNSSKLRLVQLDDGIEWIFQNLNGENTFVITMEDYEIYESFFNLFSKISKGIIISEEEIEELHNIYMCDKEFFNINKDFRESISYKKIFRDNVVHYTSDSYMHNGDEVTISLGEDYVKLNFISNQLSNIKVIKFCDKQTNYFNLAKPFIRHFEELKDVDLDYHQLTFYDITKKAF